MKPTSPLSLFVLLSGLIDAQPYRRTAKPPYFLLIGDFTVAVLGGWGDGFLSYLKDPAEGENRARSGTTTSSWKSNGRWNDLMEAIDAFKDDYEPVVTLQFGHNDQKSLTSDEYRANLVNMTSEIELAGGTPVIITPLTHRNFEGDKVKEDFVVWREKAITAAKDVGITWLDLTTRSTDYINAIGKENATYYNLDGDDGTHLSPAGEAIFGRMALDMLPEKRTDLNAFFEMNKALSDLIYGGKFATGDERKV